jgi:hypothetical protein
LAKAEQALHLEINKETTLSIEDHSHKLEIMVINHRITITLTMAYIHHNLISIFLNQLIKINSKKEGNDYLFTY